MLQQFVTNIAQNVYQTKLTSPPITKTNNIGDKNLTVERQSMLDDGFHSVFKEFNK